MSATLPLRPIGITTTGRSGSSLLMALLSQHPAIVVARGHPYEVKLLCYHALAYTTLTAGADRDHSTDPDTMLAEQNRFFIGFNPYNDAHDAAHPSIAAFWQDAAPHRTRAWIVDLHHDYYTRIAAAQAKPSARYFAEKIGTSERVRQAIGAIYPDVAEILLVRDPRDIVCSSRRFWGHGFAEAVNSLASQFTAMSAPRRVPATQLIVRYEELVTDPDISMRRIFDFLVLPPALLDTQTNAVAFHAHATSTTPMSSIGRWRRDLTDAEADHATHALQPFITRFGYTHA